MTLSLWPLFFGLISSPFWFTFGVGLYGIRLAADYFHVRLHWTKKGPKLSFFQLMKRDRGVHLHHFIWAFPSFVISFVLLEFDIIIPAQLLLGFALALVVSESKELILMKWGP